MKIRYLFFTLLAACIAICGLFILTWKTVTKTDTKVPMPAVSSSSVVTTNHAPQETVAPATGNVQKDTMPPVDTAIPSPQKQPAKNLHSAKTFQQIIEKYAHTQPANWGNTVGKMVYRVSVPQTNERIVFLTFDAYTKDHPALFELLQKHAVKSTLFLTGVWVRRNKEQAKKIGALPHLFEIENHGNKNKPLSTTGDSAYTISGTLTLADALNEVTYGATAIEEATGQQPRYVRSFLGYTDNVVVNALDEAGIKTIGATSIADGGGSFRSETITNQILQAPHGAILLLNINPDYPNILIGLQTAIEQIAKEKLPVRFELLADYEQYFDYLP